MGIGRAMARKEVGTPVAALVSVGLLGGVFMGSLVFAGPHIWAQAFRSGVVASLTFYFPFYFGLIIFDIFIAVLSAVFGGHANQAPEASTNIAAEKKQVVVLMTMGAVLISVGLVGGLFITILAFAAPHIWASTGIFDSFQTVLSDVIRGYANPAPEALANFTAVCIFPLPVVAILALKSHLVGKSMWVGLIPVLILIFVKTAAIEEFRLRTDWEEKDIMTMRRWSGQSTLISCMLVMGVVRKPFGIGVNKAELPASSGKEEPVSSIEEENLNLPTQKGET